MIRRLLAFLCIFMLALAPVVSDAGPIRLRLHGGTVTPPPPTPGAGCNPTTPYNPWTGTTRLANAFNILTQINASSPGDIVELVDTFAYASGIPFNNITKAQPGVLIRAKAGHNVVLPGNVTVNNSTGLNFRGGRPGSDASGTITFNWGNGGNGISIDGSSYISVSYATFAHGGSRNGVAVFFRSADHINIYNNDISQTGSGISNFTSTSDALIQCNTVHNFETDGIFTNTGDDFIVRGNTVYDIHTNGGGDHPDLYQFNGNNNLEVSYNNFYTGPLSVFAGGTLSPGGIFGEHTNGMTVTRNAVFGASTNGLTLSDTDNATMTENYLQAYSGGASTGGYTRDASDNNSWVGTKTTTTISSAIGGPNTGFSETGTVTISAASSISDLTAFNAWIAARDAALSSAWSQAFLP